MAREGSTESAKKAKKRQGENEEQKREEERKKKEDDEAHQSALRKFTLMRSEIAYMTGKFSQLEDLKEDLRRQKILMNEFTLAQSEMETLKKLSRP